LRSYDVNGSSRNEEQEELTIEDAYEVNRDELRYTGLNMKVKYHRRNKCIPVITSM